MSATMKNSKRGRFVTSAIFALKKKKKKQGAHTYVEHFLTGNDINKVSINESTKWKIGSDDYLYTYVMLWLSSLWLWLSAQVHKLLILMCKLAALQWGPGLERSSVQCSLIPSNAFSITLVCRANTVPERINLTIVNNLLSLTCNSFGDKKWLKSNRTRHNIIYVMIIEVSRSFSTSRK